MRCETCSILAFEAKFGDPAAFTTVIDRRRGFNQSMVLVIRMSISRKTSRTVLRAGPFYRSRASAQVF